MFTSLRLLSRNSRPRGDRGGSFYEFLALGVLAAVIVAAVTPIAAHAFGGGADSVVCRVVHPMSDPSVCAKRPVGAGHEPQPSATPTASGRQGDPAAATAQAENEISQLPDGPAIVAWMHENHCGFFAANPKDKPKARNCNYPIWPSDPKDQKAFQGVGSLYFVAAYYKAQDPAPDPLKLTQDQFVEQSVDRAVRIWPPVYDWAIAYQKSTGFTLPASVGGVITGYEAARRAGVTTAEREAANRGGSLTEAQREAARQSAGRAYVRKNQTVDYLRALWLNAHGIYHN